MESGATRAEILKIRNVAKSFGPVQALRGMNLDVYPGRVHTLLGENGAGKSTLMKILAGIYPQTEGTIEFEGRPYAPKDPQSAVEAGISTIFQELSLSPNRSVAENIYASHLPSRHGMVRDSQLYAQAADLVKELGLPLDVRARVADLSLATRQLVEIAKALSHASRVVVMDEPTSSLSDNEADLLFQIIARLKAKNIAIIYISHRMEEIMRISDDITVMRDGEYIATCRREDTSIDRLIAMMVGRPMQDIYPARLTPRPAEDIAPVLQVDHLSAEKLFHDISFSVRPGEILGFFGLVGAGRSDVMKAIFGRAAYTGEIRINGKIAAIHHPKDAIDLGVAFVTENRKEEGLVLPHSIERNVSMVSFAGCLPAMSLARPQAERTSAVAQMARLSIRAPNILTLAGDLSGGNQQKVVLAKWLTTTPRILILDEPTRGIDVGAKFEIYKIMRDLAAQGTAILMVSSELSEILGLSDRVIVMHDKKLKASLPVEGLTQENIMAYATGVFHA